MVIDLLPMAQVICSLSQELRRALLSVLREHGREPCPHAIAGITPEYQNIVAFWYFWSVQCERCAYCCLTAQGLSA